MATRPRPSRAVDVSGWVLSPHSPLRQPNQECPLAAGFVTTGPIRSRWILSSRWNLSCRAVSHNSPSGCWPNTFAPPPQPVPVHRARPGLRCFLLWLCGPKLSPSATPSSAWPGPLAADLRHPRERPAPGAAHTGPRPPWSAEAIRWGGRSSEPGLAALLPGITIGFCARPRDRWGWLYRLTSGRCFRREGRRCGRGRRFVNGPGGTA